VWKNYATNVAQLQVLDGQTKDDKLWWQALRLRMIEVNATKLGIGNNTANITLANVTFCDVPNATCLTQLKTEFPTVGKAWDDNNCDFYSNDYTCRWGFPECKNDQGVVSQCEISCKKMDVCLAKTYEACVSANNSTFGGVLNCKTYAETITPEEAKDYLLNGERNCAKFCKENQNDYDPNAAFTLQASLFLALVPALVLNWF